MNVDEEIKIRSYRRVAWKYAISWIGIFCTIGFLRLIFYWKPEWWLTLTCEPSSAAVATAVLIEFPTEEKLVRQICIANNDYVSQLMQTNNIQQPEEVRTAPVLAFQLPQSQGEFRHEENYRFFHVRKMTYFYDDEASCFIALHGIDLEINCSKLCKLGENANGLNSIVHFERLATYGLNRINIELKPIWKLLFTEILNPFYVFQVFSVCLWFYEKYNYYAGCIIIMTTLSISITIYQIRSNQISLQKKVQSTSEAEVIRDGIKQTVLSSHLVPGDLIVIPSNGCKMECDAVLISGACVVNESMLTGESVPVAKTKIPNEQTLFSHRVYSKSTLYNGTSILQARFLAHEKQTTALVIRTSYLTAKGQLVRSILYPKPIDSRFINDLLKMLLILVIIAAVGFVYTVVKMLLAHYGAAKIIVKALDMITIVVPPALPAAMTIGIIYAKYRLQKKSIFCISPSTINTCGEVNTVVFDKTGTLTEDGLSFNCVLPFDRNSNQFGKECFEHSFLRNSKTIEAMVSCHSLAIINGKIVGDPLEIAVFEWANFKLRESKSDEEAENVTYIIESDRQQADNPIKLGIIRQFVFQASMQRMSVIVKNYNEDSYWLFAKGSPVIITSLCNKSSVPNDYEYYLNYYSGKGFRTLAIAGKEIPAREILQLSRDDAERNLIFLGLFSLVNKLKPETSSIIDQLNDAQIKIYMATGDNILTALNVAQECGILSKSQPIYTANIVANDSQNDIEVRYDHWDSISAIDHSSENKARNEEAIKCPTLTNLKQFQIAMSGDCFTTLRKSKPELMAQLAKSTVVYGRMKPEHKTELIHQLQEMGLIVAMCGDGANDCGALKASNAGVSLSEAEASIASPFTCTTGSIACMPTLLRHGRCALVTSFGIFKYMAGYSLNQFFSTSLCYWLGTTLSDFQFLYEDLFVSTMYAIFFGFTAPCSYLSSKPPPSRILSIANVVSIFLHVVIMGFFQTFIFIHVKHQPWFVPFTDPGDEASFLSYQITCVFLLAIFQMMGLCVIWSTGFPYRKPIYTNIPLTIWLCFTGVVNTLMTIYSPKFLENLLILKPPPFYEYRGFVLLLAVLYWVISIAAEYIIIEVLIQRITERFSWRKRNKITPKVKNYRKGQENIAFDSTQV